jgi:hypothetical protein
MALQTYSGSDSAIENAFILRGFKVAGILLRNTSGTLDKTLPDFPLINVEFNAFNFL